MYIPRIKRFPRGFSLVELLVVILIISLLLTLGAVGMRGLEGGKGISSAVATSEALFDEARSLAVGKGTKARVLVDVTDAQDNINYLRRMFVAYEELNDQGEATGKWAVASRAIILPDKIFFSRDFSRKNHQSGGGAPLESQDLTFDKKAFDGSYIVYEFNSEGIATDPGSSFVVGAGARPTGDQPRTTSASGKRDFGGFLVWRNGRTSMFRSVDQIGIPAETTVF